GIDFSLHLLLHAVLERIHLRAHLHFLDPEQDGPGRDRQRVRRRRHLPVGLAHGGGSGRLAAAGDPLRLLRRALRFGDDGRGQGIDAAAFCWHPLKKGPSARRGGKRSRKGDAVWAREVECPWIDRWCGRGAFALLVRFRRSKWGAGSSTPIPARSSIRDDGRWWRWRRSRWVSWRGSSRAGGGRWR